MLSRRVTRHIYHPIKHDVYGLKRKLLKQFKQSKNTLYLLIIFIRIRIKVKIRNQQFSRRTVTPKPSTGCIFPFRIRIERCGISISPRVLDVKMERSVRQTRLDLSESERDAPVAFGPVHAHIKSSAPAVILKSLLNLSRIRPAILPTAAAAFIAISSPSHATQPPSDIQAVSWMVVDGESDQMLVEHNADADRQPASLTKLMTAYIVLESLKRGAMRWDEKVMVDAAETEKVGGDEAKMYLVPGQLVSIRELVQGLIAASANDAAMVLATRVGGSPAGFEALMNAKAHELGMDHTHYSTPSGITTPGNYTTARDLSILALRLTKDFPEYYTFSSEQHFAYGKFQKRNKNWLLGKDPSVDGMKTGHTQAAGFCIVATAKRKQASPSMSRRVFAVLLGAPTAHARIAGAGSLLNYGFSAFTDYPGSDGRHIVTRKVVAGGSQRHQP